LGNSGVSRALPEQRSNKKSTPKQSTLYNDKHLQEQI
jgi:hypothetical protein